jgi:hypothetical protein
MEVLHMGMRPLVVIAVAVFYLSGMADAALWDRDGGLVYDDVLKVTWLQDANFAKTSGYDADGKMTWAAADTWASGLNYYDSARNQYLSGWRLPVVRPVDGTAFNYERTSNGSSDIGWNISAPDSVHPGSTASELAYMYYVNLGNLGQVYPDGQPVPSNEWGVKNSGPFFNLNLNDYWTGTFGNPNYHNNFNAFIHYYYTGGGQEIAPRSDEFTAWLVRDGDVGPATVPIPAAAWLLGSGLIGLLALRRRFHSS